MSLLGPLRRIASGGALKLHDLAVPELELDRLLAGPHAGAGEGAFALFDRVWITSDRTCLLYTSDAADE